MSESIDQRHILNAKVSVVIASDIHIVRAGLCSFLRGQAAIEVIVDVGLADALEHVRNSRPRVLLLHFTESSPAAVKLTSRVRTEIRSTAVVAVSYAAEHVYVRSLLIAGAIGYILSRGKPEDLITAICKAARGRSFLDPLLSDGIIQMLVQRPARQRNNTDSVTFLTEREEQVLKYVALGYTHREIADELALSEKTVDTYRARIHEKTNLRTRAEIVRYAIAAGLVELSPDS